MRNEGNCGFRSLHILCKRQIRMAKMTVAYVGPWSGRCEPRTGDLQSPRRATTCPHVASYAKIQYTAVKRQRDSGTFSDTYKIRIIMNKYKRYSPLRLSIAI